MTRLGGNIFFDGPAGRIEAILKEPDGPITRAAVVCHPHPLFGGTMHNKVVYRIAKALEQAGFAVLRFNFRGTGLSEGTHDHGKGEQDDLRAAVRFLEENYPDAEILLAGFSFGSMVMLSVASEDPRILAVIAAGVPVSKYDGGKAVAFAGPKLFVQGSLDEFGSREDVERLVAGLDEPKELRIIAGADHFFEGHLEELSAAVGNFALAIDEQLTRK